MNSGHWALARPWAPVEADLPGQGLLEVLGYPVWNLAWPGNQQPRELVTNVTLGPTQNS